MKHSSTKQKIRTLLSVLFLSLLSIGNTYGQDWFFDAYYEEHCFAFTAGYASQKIEYKAGDFRDYDDGVWFYGNKKRLNGFFFPAFYFNKSFFYGVGLYTGFSMEWFFSSNNPSYTWDIQAPDDIYDSYAELSFNIPIHLQFKMPLPISDDVALGFHTGPGMTLSYYANYSNDHHYYNDFFSLGESGYFKIFNLTYDIGLFAEWRKLRIDVEWDRGLLNQKLLVDEADKSLRHRFKVSISFIFG